MNEKDIKLLLDDIKKDHSIFISEKDKVSLMYIYEITDLFYNELKLEIYDKEDLYDLMYNIFRKNLGIIFKNMSEYTIKAKNHSVKNIEELIKISISNSYIDIKNLSNLYDNFAKEINTNYKIDNKIKSLVDANVDVLEGGIFTKLEINNESNIKNIISKYKNLYTIEMIGNVNSKKDNLLSLYKNFINSILSETKEKRDEIIRKNLNMVENTSYLVLKQNEYLNINKYIKLNNDIINKTFETLDESFNKIAIKKRDDSRNKAKDFLLGFNNTIDNKTKNIFDEMNLIVTLDNENMKTKLKEFNELITHVFEMNLVFDKQFEEYKKTFTFISKDADKVNKALKDNKRFLIDSMKANIFNIFRDNIKIFNDIVYKVMLLKANIEEYNTVLEKDKIKDLILK